MRLFAKAVLAAAVAAAFSTHCAAQETRLLMTSLSPGGSTNSVFFNQWAQKLADQSGGAVKIDVRDGATLAHFGNVYERVQDDVVQIGWAIHQVVAGKFPLSEVAGLPFVEDGFSRASLALYRLSKSGLLNNENKDVVPLVYSVFGPSQLHFARQPRSIDDLNGVKVGVTGRAPSQLVAALGGTPISMQPGEFYEALQRRTIDAAITSWSAFAPYKLQEVTSYHVETLLGQGTSMFFMAKKKFDALPEPARKVLAANADEATTLAFGKHFDAQWHDARKPVASSDKHTIVQLSPEQTAKWRSKFEPVLQEWVKGRANGEEAMTKYRELYKQAGS
ncbi:MAG TPA: TRAP transporter substrate-binding protein [Xanthobacteraceae bacterium]|nr:TRAP transporter substrate-binding protein [Xanthobacteraceae bacterium]